MPKKTNLTQENAYIRSLFSGMSQRVAYLDAYPNARKLALATVDSKASRLANSGRVQAALAELRQKAEDASIATVVERKQILSEIARGRLADFLTNPTPEKLRSAALQEITIVETKGSKSTKVRLHDIHKAVDILNKMEGIYTDGPTVNVDNRQVVIKVVYGNQDGSPLELGAPPAESQGAS